MMPEHPFGFGHLFWKLFSILVISMALLVSGTVRLLSFIGCLSVSPPRIYPLGLVAASVTIAILVISFVIAWYLSHPICHLRWVVRRLSEGRLDTRTSTLNGYRWDEIFDLAHDLDSMAAQLQQQGQTRLMLLHEISHEFRSPLMRLQVATGLLRQDPTLNASMVDRIERESSRMDKLIDEMLMLHHLDSDMTNEPRQYIDMAELLQSVIDDADFEARASGQTLRFFAPDGFVTKANGEQLYRAYENVIRNALKFSSTGSEVHVLTGIASDGQSLITTVQDRGPGVPPEMLEAIFEPFTRVAGHESVRGTGLGLAIARRAMLLHGGSSMATSREGGGLIVTLWLPKQD